MKRKIKTSPAFSLTELIVVVAIISIMSASGVVGFRYMGDTLRTKEAAGVITDTIKKAEMEILREEYTKNTIHFLSDYLVIVSQPEEASMDLEFNGTACVTPGDSGNLIKTDEEGNRLGIDTVTAASPPTYTCNDFTASSETEWRYQILSDGEVSDIIRFIHFNIDRVNLSGITTDGNINKTVTIEAPYGKKTITDGTFDLTVTSPEGHTETLTIQ